MKIASRLTILLYVLGVIALFLYSYTQVDLSLTLSKLSIWQVIEKSFQYIGYFQRPLSTGLFIGLLVLFIATYSGLLLLTAKKQISRKTLWQLVIFTGVVLTFAYNAFSYDLFNYIFDAKIITHYFQNPYLHSALDFPHDPMLSFMHWTQRTYPYGPTWLLVTVPISFAGLQFFLPTFFGFKAIASASYLLTAWCIEKILKKIDPENSLFGLTIFAFSPLVIFEGLVSAHNDMAMVVLASCSVLLLLNKKYVWSFLLLFLSIGIKFATAMLLPLWIVWLSLKKKDPRMEKLFLVSFFVLIVPVVAASLRTNFQPWYLLFLFPFVALLPKSKPVLVGFSIFSIASLLQYVPFLYVGNWDNPIPYILSVMLWSSLAVCLIAAGMTLLFQVAKKK